MLEPPFYCYNAIPVMIYLLQRYNPFYCYNAIPVMIYLLQRYNPFYCYNELCLLWYTCYNVTTLFIVTMSYTCYDILVTTLQPFLLLQWAMPVMIYLLQRYNPFYCYNELSLLWYTCYNVTTLFIVTMSYTCYDILVTTLQPFLLLQWAMPVMIYLLQRYNPFYCYNELYLLWYTCYNVTTLFIVTMSYACYDILVTTLQPFLLLQWAMPVMIYLLQRYNPFYCYNELSLLWYTCYNVTTLFIVTMSYACYDILVTTLQPFLLLQWAMPVMIYLLQRYNPFYCYNELSLLWYTCYNVTTLFIVTMSYACYDILVTTLQPFLLLLRAIPLHFFQHCGSMTLWIS